MWGIGGVAAILAAWTKKEAIVDYFERGKVLTSTSPDAGGVIRVAPAELARRASVVMGRDVSREAYALGRMSRSERGKNESQTGQRLRMHVALNDLAQVSWADTVEELFTYSNQSGEKGFFGDQLGRRYATTRDPYEGDVLLAEAVIVEHQAGIDPTAVPGLPPAIKFVDKKSMGGVQKGTGTYEALVERWAPEGLRPFTVAGAPEDFVVFRRTG